MKNYKQAFKELRFPRGSEKSSRGEDIRAKTRRMREICKRELIKFFLSLKVLICKIGIIVVLTGHSTIMIYRVNPISWIV